MFARPRLKKSALGPPPKKKRRTNSAVEEVNFDNDARQEYLTGFHKRKQHRIKLAQAEAAKRARLERLEMRKHVREERKREAQEHVDRVNALLREAEVAGNVEAEGSDKVEAEEWDGIKDALLEAPIDEEQEYVDEDRYTTVTVESVSVTRDGFQRPGMDSQDEEDENEAGEADRPSGNTNTDRKAELKRPAKRKKFRYENKVERQLEQKKQMKSKKRRPRK